jgi:hypothetical protein
MRSVSLILRYRPVRNNQNEGDKEVTVIERIWMFQLIVKADVNATGDSKS